MKVAEIDYITKQITSKYTDYTYTINIYIPNNEAPEEGFPILYVLDGSSYFGLVKEAVRLQSGNALKTNVAPSIVVGIGHGADMRERRFYDFTAPAATYIYPERFKGKGHDKLGGAANFSRFLEEELKPAMEEQYPINRERQALFGHSLAGYFSLWQLFHHPSSFHSYLAISPSIWWNEHELFQYASKCLTKYEKIQETLFISAGELENTMVDDARQMMRMLRDIMDVGFYKALDENHASVVPTVMSRAIRFMHQST
ncbi:alpha/beta hydrolase [Lysinibacillus sp. NPDC098008]|uniref:alpha/beta hydrolase n=1 Tax=Lysinibacillus sp. NPDC098008 TaxID=3364146 RepID=UPI0038136AFC